MFKKVLIATDLSEASIAMVKRVGEVPPGVREVILFHVRTSAASIPADGPIRRMQELVLRQGGFSVEVVIAENDGTTVTGRILRAATETGADLIAMGVRNQGGLLRNLLGRNVAATVLRDARTHVLVVPQPAEGRPLLFSRLLVPTDLTALAPEVRSLLEFPAGDGTAVLLHVVEPGRAGTEPEATGRLSALHNDLTLPAGRKLRAWCVPDPRHARSAQWQKKSAPLRSSSRMDRRDAAGSISLGLVAAGVVECVRPPVLVLAVPIHLAVETRELRSEEFALAEEIWVDYHELKADLKTDRIFGVFAGEFLVSVARCRRHPDGCEVDGVFTPPVRFRGGKGGYARRAMDALVEACQHDTLYMHSVRNLVDFYGGEYGFISIPESDLPPTIRARYAFALGEMEGGRTSSRCAGPQAGSGDNMFSRDRSARFSRRRDPGILHRLRSRRGGTGHR
ncbi:universal stress protein [Methanoculleus chikugoensis]|uniref:universal stress protein n=1 Tax=Methanoculleus chikugoensis TaxID=118126 RepID=UPI000B0E324F|nr:universal stress protein [Methanoculleus chikugoensis]